MINSDSVSVAFSREKPTLSKRSQNLRVTQKRFERAMLIEKTKREKRAIEGSETQHGEASHILRVTQLPYASHPVNVTLSIRASQTT